MTEAGLTWLEQLAQVSEAELLKMHGVGPKAVQVLRRALQEKGLDFARPGSGTQQP